MAFIGARRALIRMGLPNITIDGNTINNAIGTAATTVAVALTTANANTLAVVFIQGSLGVASVADTSGLTWTHRGSANRFSAQFGDVFESIVPTARTMTITATYTGSANSRCINAVGFSGVNSSAPYDTNGSLPGLVGTGGAGAAEVVVSTTNAKTLVYAFYTYGSAATPVGGPGWTVLQNAVNSFMLTQYKLFSSAQTSLTLSQGSAVSDINIGIGDAVKP